METMRDIKRRINSVENTQKITRAMKMVAAAKLRKAQDKAEDARPFFQKTREILLDIAKYSSDVREHPLLVEKEGNRRLYIVISGDRGLCGAYNSKVMDKVEDSISKEDETSLLVIGQKGRDYFKKEDYEIISEYVQIDDYPDFSFARRVGEEVISLFKKNVVDKVSLVYTHFNSAINQTTKLMSLLPVTAPIEKSNETDDEKDNKKKSVDYIYEPSPTEILDILLPRYVNNILYSALLESKASEFGARMTSMDAATDNAGELIEELTLSYNRARQAEITKEITEIVGGAEALK